AIISKVLDELNQTHERAGQLALGVTVLEDVVAVVMLTLLTSVVQYGGGGASSVLSTLGALGAFVVFIALLSLLIVPRLLSRLSRSGQPEILVLVVAGLLLSLAWLAAAAGYSMALGAFVLGAIVGSTRFKAAIERTFSGLRDMFGAVFFVAVGMMVDFRDLGEAWPMVLLVTGLALLLRPLACAAGLLAAGNPGQASFQAGLALVPLGEFSFIIAQLGVGSGELPASFYPVAVGASLLTSLAAPIVTRRAGSWSEALTRMEPKFLRDWTELYPRLLNRLRTGSASSILWRLTGRRIIQAGVQTLFVSALILFARPLYGSAEELLGRDWLFANGLMVMFCCAIGLLALAPVIALWRNVSALAMIFAESATSGSHRQRHSRVLLEFALRAVALTAFVVWLLALLPGDRTFLGVAAGSVVLLAVVGVVFRRRFIRLHSRLEIELLEELKRASHVAAASAWSGRVADPHRDWNVEIEEVTLPGDTAHAGKTIGQLAVRGRHGCSIIGVDRSGHGVQNPRADFALFPYDKLLLLGRKADLEQAVRFLGTTGAPAGGESFDEITLLTLAVPADSPAAGRSLLELDLIGRTGVQVAGIHRRPKRIIAPTGSDCLEAGDELLVLGTQEQVHRLHEVLQPADRPA
ncbi:MAG TPA: hypothetical protein DCY13_12405, partial [Verrucomicrobiales bacterium]|nr:hypothetical protein [Verrucomicrobiales bacterium]